MFSEPGFIETTADLELVVSNTSMYSEVECEIAVRKKELLGMGTYTGTLAPGEYKYFTFPGTVNGEEVNPYYFQKSGDNKCVMEKIGSDDKWVRYTTGMNSSSPPMWCASEITTRRRKPHTHLHSKMHGGMR